MESDMRKFLHIAARRQAMWHQGFSVSSHVCPLILCTTTKWRPHLKIYRWGSQGCRQTFVRHLVSLLTEAGPVMGWWGRVLALPLGISCVQMTKGWAGLRLLFSTSLSWRNPSQPETEWYTNDHICPLMSRMGLNSAGLLGWVLPCSDF